MPIYEYECLACKRITQHLVLGSGEFTPYCSKCGSLDVKKIISKVRVKLSEETRLERLADPDLIGGLEREDPRAMQKFVEKIGSLSDDGFDDSDIKHIVEETMDTSKEEE